MHNQIDNFRLELKNIYVYILQTSKLITKLNLKRWANIFRLKLTLRTKF